MYAKLLRGLTSRTIPDAIDNGPKQLEIFLSNEISAIAGE
jgi:hypothetical protein